MLRREENENYITVSGSIGNYGISGPGSGLEISGASTGSVGNIGDYRIIRYPFDKYEIGVVVDSNNRFMGICEIAINKDFLSPRQRIATRSYIDVDDYYKE